MDGLMLSLLQMITIELKQNSLFKAFKAKVKKEVFSSTQFAFDTLRAKAAEILHSQTRR